MSADLSPEERAVEVLDEILAELRLEAVHPKGYRPNGRRFQEKLSARGLHITDLTGEEAQLALECVEGCQYPRASVETAKETQAKLRRLSSRDGVE